MSDNPAFKALAGGDSSPPVERTTNSEQSRNDPARALSHSVTVCTPLIAAALDEEIVEPEETGEAVGHMLTAAGELVASVQAGLQEDGGSISDDLKQRIRYLCVSVVASVWRRAQEVPVGMSETILQVLQEMSSGVVAEEEDSRLTGYFGAPGGVHSQERRGVLAFSLQHRHLPHTRLPEPTGHLPLAVRGGMGLSESCNDLLSTSRGGAALDRQRFHLEGAAHPHRLLVGGHCLCRLSSLTAGGGG